MKNKLLCLLLCLTVLLSVGAPAVKANRVYTVVDAQAVCGGIVGYKSGGSAQEFINNELCRDVGSSAEFYIIALSQQGNYDFSRYEKALLKYLKNNEVYSATTREKYALALIASGSTDSYISSVADEAIGGLGLMSLVFGLHILNNGYKSKLYTADNLVSTILGYQLKDGGWAVIGNRGDVDVTAMTMQSLAPYYRSRADVTNAVDRGLALLSEKQQSDGGYIGMGVENCESAAQVLTALSDLGVDPNTDKRFVKNGNSVLDAVMSYRNAEGSFAHTGSGFNETATVEVFYAMTAYMRHCRGQGPLYVLDHRRPESVETAEKPAKKKNKSNNDQQQKSETPKQSEQNKQSKPQTEQKNNHQQAETIAKENSSKQRIIYINGQAYREVTDSKGHKETVAVEETEATTATTQAATERDAGKGAGLFQPTATATEHATADEAAPPQKGSYKPIAIIAVLSAAIIAALVLFLLKKRNKKHYIAVAILAAAGVLFILLTNFESKESYRAVQEKADTVGSVTISVRCDTLKDEKKPAQIPDDCVILDEAIFGIADGDTVYSILLEASKRCGFQIDNRGAAGSAYIAGIEYLYEFDYGDLSGWMYKVNGEFPDVGCQSYTLHDGDRIEWLYTKNIGKDLD